MDFKKCNRCGSFYISEGDVCPKCNAKDTFELETFKSYIEKNGTTNSIETISQKTGIPMRHLSRFLGYEQFKPYAKEFTTKNPLYK